MRFSVLALLLGALLSSGCGHKKAAAPFQPGKTAPNPVEFAPPPATQEQKLIVTPDNALVGKVVRVNPGGRYVVLNFPIGRLPALQQRLNLYRRGLKVGEVTISGPQRDDNIIADVTSGDAAVGDEARDR